MDDAKILDDGRRGYAEMYKMQQAPLDVAWDHCRWARGHGMTAGEVCTSVGLRMGEPGWPMAVLVVAVRMAE